MKKWLKNLILSLVLVVFLSTGTVVFSACGSKTYALTNLNSDYLTILSGYENISVSSDGVFTFDYSVYKTNEDVTYLKNAVDNTSGNTAQYNYLNSYYNVLLANSMEFINYALPLCSKASVEVDAVVYDELQTDLESFSTAIDSVSKRMDYLAEIVNANQADVTNYVCLNRLNNLFSSYDDLFQAVFGLNSTISNIYYNYALKNGNPDISAIEKSNFDEYNIQVVLSNLPGRINYHIANYTLVFVELNLVGADVADEITSNGTSPLTTDFDTYKSAISAIDITLTDGVASKISGNETYRESFYDLAVEMYNLQLTMSNNYQVYRTASRTIRYNEIINDANAAEDELLCVYVIDNYASLVKQYHEVLCDVVEIIQA